MTCLPSGKVSWISKSVVTTPKETKKCQFSLFAKIVIKVTVLFLSIFAHRFWLCLNEFSVFWSLSLSCNDLAGTRGGQHGPGSPCTAEHKGPDARGSCPCEPAEQRGWVSYIPVEISLVYGRFFLQDVTVSTRTPVWTRIPFTPSLGMIWAPNKAPTRCKTTTTWWWTVNTTSTLMGRCANVAEIFPRPL